MSKNNILLDSNAYFRLADNLYPLLSQSFGKKDNYRLVILGGTLREYNYQTRLQSKFDWVDSPCHKDDRKKNKLRIKREDKEIIKKSTRFIITDSASRELGCSRFDIECLATAMELSIKLVTDDRDLYDLAKEYEVDCISTLELLKFMLDEKRVKLSDIQGTVVMWDYMNDFPRNFIKDFRKIFNIEPDRY